LALLDDVGRTFEVIEVDDVVDVEDVVAMKKTPGFRTRRSGGADFMPSPTSNREGHRPSIRAGDLAYSDHVMTEITVARQRRIHTGFAVAVQKD
jgi:hypothetical protein